MLSVGGQKIEFLQDEEPPFLVQKCIFRYLGQAYYVQCQVSLQRTCAGDLEPCKGQKGRAKEFILLVRLRVPDGLVATTSFKWK